jgi:hypothetical protein
LRLISVVDSPISDSAEAAIIVAVNTHGVLRSNAAKHLLMSRGPRVQQAFQSVIHSYGSPRILAYNHPQLLVAAPVESSYPASRRPDVVCVCATWREALTHLLHRKIPSVAHTLPVEFPERTPDGLMHEVLTAWIAVLREFDSMTHVIYAEGNSIVRGVLHEGTTSTSERDEDPEPLVPDTPMVADDPPPATVTPPTRRPKKR